MAIQKNKNILPIEKIAKASPLNFFFQLSSGTKNEQTSLRTLDKTLLLAQVFSGLGLIQMMEFLIRTTNFKNIFKIFLNRIKLILYLTQLTLYRIERSQDQENSMTYIRSLLSSNKFNN